ncbi:MAG: hypothetical protein Q8P20_01100 [bacterium]|nr:hypothetical protein [bacterium]
MQDEMYDDVGSVMPDMDFETEAVPQLLVPEGKYKAVISSTSFNTKINALVIAATLADNDDRFASDNVTPVNGLQLDFLAWFPKSGDELKQAKTKQKMTVRQQKITALKTLFEGFGITINKTSDIQDKVLTNCELVGKEVMVGIAIDTYKGKIDNKINSIMPFSQPEIA